MNKSALRCLSEYFSVEQCFSERDPIVTAVPSLLPAQLPDGHHDGPHHQAQVAQRHQHQETLQLYRYSELLYGTVMLYTGWLHDLSKHSLTQSPLPRTGCAAMIGFIL